MVAGIAYTIAQSVVFFIGQTDADPAAVTDAATSPTLPPVNIQAVMDRHLFGPADVQSDVSTVAPSVETRLPLELQAVFVATEDGAESKAIIDRLEAELRVAHPERFAAAPKKSGGCLLLLILLFPVAVLLWFLFRR